MKWKHLSEPFLERDVAEEEGEQEEPGSSKARIHPVTGRTPALQGSAAPLPWAIPFQILVAPKWQQLKVGSVPLCPSLAGRKRERQSKQILWVSGAERGSLAASSDVPILVLPALCVPLTPSHGNIPGREDTKYAPWLQECLIWSPPQKRWAYLHFPTEAWRMFLVTLFRALSFAPGLLVGCKSSENTCILPI